MGRISGLGSQAAGQPQISRMGDPALAGAQGIAPWFFPYGNDMISPRKQERLIGRIRAWFEPGKGLAATDVVPGAGNSALFRTRSVTVPSARMRAQTPVAPPSERLWGAISSVGSREFPSFSSAFHKESQPFTVSAQRHAAFPLLPCEPRRTVSDIQARCSACPARALRQSRRFRAVLEGELPGGSLQSAFRRALVGPGVAASSPSPPHTAGLAVGHRAVLEIDSWSTLREGGLPSTRFRRCSWERRWPVHLPMPRARKWVTGYPAKQCGSGGWPGPHFFGRRSWAGSGEFLLVDDSGCESPGFNHCLSIFLRLY